MKKRMFALVLALCLMLSMMPVPAFAEGEEGKDTAVTQEPATSEVPAKPAEPATPVVPETPAEPAIPVVPETPAEPAIPVVPETPAEPATPVVPETPAEPATPVVPETPAEPATPVVPETPAEPATPVVPETPAEPATPVVPETPAEPATPVVPETPTEPTPVQKVQSLIDALPEADTITAENREAVEAQLDAIDQAKLLLDEGVDTLNTGKYEAAVAALHALDGMPGAEVPKTMEVQSLTGATVSVTKSFRYNGNPQTLEASDVTVTLDGTSLVADTDYTITAAPQTVPGSYSFTVTGKGNYTGTVSGIWSIGKGQLSEADKHIYIKVKQDGTTTIDVADRLPGLVGGCFSDPTESNSSSIICDEKPTTVTVRMVVPDGTNHTVDITFNEGTSYYESTKMTLHILVVDSASGQNKPLTVSMADWEKGDEPNKPTVTGLPKTPYNYNVSYAKKDGTALSAAPAEAGEYTVTVTYEDSENNAYSGSADFTVWKKCTVTFDPNGGQLPAGASATATTKNGKLSAAFPTPSWDGYVFKGWYTEKTGGSGVGASTAFSSDTTLYAHWEKKVTSLAFTLTGYGYKEIVRKTKLTQAPGNEGITCDFAKYDGSYFICAKNGKSTSDVQFQKDKAYYISVTFGAKDGYTLEGMEKENVRLNGISATTLDFSGKEKSTGEVTALFELPAIHIIEINCGKNGSITYGDTTYKGAKTVTVSVFHGENATFTITPDKGYSRSKLWIDGDQQSKTAKEYTFKEVSDSKHTLKATFAKASDNPKTGDESHIELALDAMFIAAGALAAAFILKIKKKNLKK